MNKSYTFRKIDSHTLPLADPAWETVSPAFLDCYNMNPKPGYPKTLVRGVYSGGGISLKFETDETPEHILARFPGYGDPAYRDSCVEFFFNPDPSKFDKYFNFELSAGGGLLVGLRRDRSDKTAPEGDLSEFEIETEKTRTGWQAKLFVPFAFVERHLGAFAPVFAGNFQKCGDDTAFPHFTTWNYIDVPSPDFHRPEFFGELILGDYAL